MKAAFQIACMPRWIIVERENKNQYVLAFLYLLVQLKIFDEVVHNKDLNY